jgi:hypothetical protein
LDASCSLNTPKADSPSKLTAWKADQLLQAEDLHPARNEKRRQSIVFAT